jgi:TetR/AcrR family transcriptional regulator, transcriptional repressor of aconitase
MPKVSLEHHQSRRDQILDAAVNCFIKNGFHQTSMRDICRECGLSAGAVYLQFKSKEEIIEASWQRAEETRIRRFEQAKQAPSATAGMTDLSHYFVDRLKQPGPDKAWLLWIQLLSESVRNPEISRDIRQKWARTTTQFLDVMGQGTDHSDNPQYQEYEVYARLLVAVHDGLVLQKILDPDKDVIRYYAFFYELLAGYKPPSRPPARECAHAETKNNPTP